ncbi:MAG: hypothetical protein MJE63_10480 [Proteobacteria bacterium]|nr:hypothetical protein [Pseudomonadota bacterium]
MGVSKSQKRQPIQNQNPRLVAARSLISWLKSNTVDILARNAFQQPSDYTFYRHLVSNVIRHKSKYEFFIQKLTGKSLKKLDYEAKACLMLGLTQLETDSKVEDYAAINETVDLMGPLKKPYLKGFVNANLRRFTRERRQLENDLNRQEISIRTSHPPSFIDRWKKQFGEETADAICQANNIQPQVQLVLNPAFQFEQIISGLKTEGFHCMDIDEGTLTISNPAGLFDSEWAKKGAFLIQDRSFQPLNKIMADLPKSTVLDACSAPGGKLINLEWSFSDDIEILVGCEINQGRLKRLRENRNHFRSDAHLVQCDCSRPPFKQTFDLIILDAPCSATGTIRKHPELKWSRNRDDLIRNQMLQVKLVESCSHLLNPGGKLLYVTCSLEAEENQEVVQYFTEKKSSAIKMLPIKSSEIDGSLITNEGFYQALPSQSQMGCFAALFEKDY